MVDISYFAGSIVDAYFDFLIYIWILTEGDILISEEDTAVCHIGVRPESEDSVCEQSCILLRLRNDYHTALVHYRE